MIGKWNISAVHTGYWIEHHLWGSTGTPVQLCNYKNYTVFQGWSGTETHYSQARAPRFPTPDARFPLKDPLRSMLSPRVPPQGPGPHTTRIPLMEGTAKNRVPPRGSSAVAPGQRGLKL